MASSLNKVMIIGNVGRDPEMRYTPDGKAQAKFSVAVSRVWTNQEGERKEETEWFNVVAWDKLAEICGNYITKGQKVYVEGRLQTRTWEGPGRPEAQEHRPGGERRRVHELSHQDQRPDEEPALAAPGGGEIEPNDLPF